MGRSGFAVCAIDSEGVVVEGTRVLRSGGMLALPESFDIEALGRGVLRLFAHSTRTALVLLDPAACVIWANPAFDALGLSTGDRWLGRALMELLLANPAPGIEPSEGAELLRQALLKHAATHTTLGVRTGDGRRLWLEADLQPLQQAGAPLLGFALVLTDVSARVRERQRLRNLIDATIAGIVVQDDCGRIVDCNAEAERLLGRSRAQLFSSGADSAPWHAIREDGSAYLDSEHPAMRVLVNGEPVRGEVMGLLLPCGERRWIEVNAQLMTDSDSGERLVVSSFINLSAQMAVRERLSAERERLLASLDSTRAGVWEWNVAEGQLRVDGRWAGMLGYRPEQLHALPNERLAELAHPQDLDRARGLITRHIKGLSERYECELRLKHREGHWVWVQALGRVALRDADGRALRAYGTHTEIGQRKRTEDELARMQGLLAGLFERSPLGVALNDLVDGRFQDANAALLQLLGYEREALMARSYWDITPKEYAEQEAAQLCSLMDSGAYGPYEKELLHSGGQRIPVLLSGIRITQPDGAEQIWSVIQDLSERRQFEQQLQRAALTDELTGLPNRSLLMQRLAACLRDIRLGQLPGAALLFIDFDRFKVINDSLGHDAGDELLRKAASRMRASLRAVDIGLQSELGNMVARFGGDEFVVLLTDVSSSETVSQVAQRLLEAVAPAYRLQGTDVALGVSIGVVLLDGDIDSADEILRRADRAMYRAKAGGGGRIEFFSV